MSHLDGVLITHDHADQLHGIDDLRAIVLTMRKRIDVHADRLTLDGIRRRFGYIFERPDGSDYPAILNALEIPEPFGAFEISGAGGTISVLPFEQEHGRVRSLGFRFGGFAYSSDVGGLSEEAFAALEGLDCWVVDALRYKYHPTHTNVETALKWIARLKPKHAVLTNLHLDLDYQTLKAQLPPNVEPAYDGMVLTFPV